MSFKSGLKAAALVIVAILPVQAQAEAPLTFGVVPQQSASRLARVWVPLLAYLSEQTGQQIRFATAKDIPTFESCLAAGAYDIAYMNPYHYVVFHEAPGYEALARQRDKLLQGLLITRVDSSVETLDDLDGEQVAFPSPAAFGASVIPRAEIASRGITIEPDYVQSHDSVYRAVADGHYAAGGGVRRTWNTVPEDIKQNLRIFYETEGYTPHAIATAPTLTAEERAAIQNALVSLADANPNILEALGMSGFQASADSDWDDIRALNLSQDQTEVVIEAEGLCHSN